MLLFSKIMLFLSQFEYTITPKESPYRPAMRRDVLYWEQQVQTHQLRRMM